MRVTWSWTRTVYLSLCLSSAEEGRGTTQTTKGMTHNIIVRIYQNRLFLLLMSIDEFFQNGRVTIDGSIRLGRLSI